MQPGALYPDEEFACHAIDLGVQVSFPSPKLIFSRRRSRVAVKINILSMESAQVKGFQRFKFTWHAGLTVILFNSLLIKDTDYPL
jgi:hypothetical protein